MRRSYANLPIVGTVEEAVDTICTHVCRYRTGLKLNPEHCNKRKVVPKAPAVSGDLNHTWQCQECSGPLPKGSIPAPSLSKPMDAPAKAKACTKCMEIKPLSEYYVAEGMKDGKASQCKECLRIAKHKKKASAALVKRDLDRMKQGGKK